MAAKKQSKKEEEARFNIDKSKRQVIYVSNKKEPSSGVPVVVNNSREGLEDTGNYQTYLLVNGWVTGIYKLIDSQGNEIEYNGREDLLDGLKRLGNGSTDWIDILHFHTFNQSDYFYHYGGPHNQVEMDLDELLGQLPKTKTLSTSHGNPSQDIKNIEATFGVNIEGMSEDERYRFIDEHRPIGSPKRSDVESRPGLWELMALASTEQMINKVDQATFVSDYQRKRYMGNFFTRAHPKREPATIYNGADLSSYVNSPDLDALAQSARQEFKIRDDKITLLYVGRMSEEKGILELAEVVKRLNEEKPLGKEVQVVYVGGINGEIEKIKEIFGKTLPENVIITGPVNDRKKLAAIYTLADVVVQPTKGECFNQIATEALMFGKPVLISDYAGPKEVYVDQGIAFGSKPGDVDDIYKQLLYMFAHPEEVQRVTERGRLHALSELDYGAMAANYSRLYDELLGKTLETKPLLKEQAASLEQLADGKAPRRAPKTGSYNALGIDPAKKNVLLLGTTLDPSHGVPVVMNNLADGIASNPDYNVFFLTNDFGSPRIQLYTPNGEVSEFDDRAELLSFLETQGILDNFDILHLHSWHFSDYYRSSDVPIAQFLGSFRNAGVVYTDHSNPSEDRINIAEHHGFDFYKLPPQQKAEVVEALRIKPGNNDLKKGWTFTALKCKEQLMELADQVVHVSNAQKQGTREMLPLVRTKAEPKVVYNGIDTEQYSGSPEVEQRARELRSELARDGEKIILYAGRISEHKGAYDLASASRFLYGMLGMENFKIVYVGSDRLGEDSCSALTMSELFDLSGNNGHVDFLESTKDRRELAALYKMADVVVQPTHGECFNQVLGEALAMGTPVIASRTSGPEEVYVSKGVAIGHKPGNIGNLTVTLENFLNDGEVSGAMAARGQQYVATELSVEAMTQKYLEVYNSL